MVVLTSRFQWWRRGGVDDELFELLSPSHPVTMRCVGRWRHLVGQGGELPNKLLHSEGRGLEPNEVN